MVYRNKEIKVRLTETEYNNLLKHVASTSLSRESYIRTLINGYIPKEQPNDLFFESISQLRAIGNNLNQIATIANKMDVIDKERYNIELNFLRASILEIRESICNHDKIQ
ncbi:MAG: plasmid mobilization relaxosome protein MobC [Erysipelotrichaceae bacterium]